MPTTRIFDAIWGHPRDVVTAGARERLLADAGLPSREIWTRAAEPDVSAELDQRSRAAAGRGGLRCSYIRCRPGTLFGNDRLDFVTERVAA